MLTKLPYALWYLLHCPNFMTIMFSSLVGAFFGHCEIFAIVRSSSIAVTGLGLCMLRPAPGRVSGFTTSTIVQLCRSPDRQHQITCCRSPSGQKITLALKKFHNHQLFSDNHELHTNGQTALAGLQTIVHSMASMVGRSEGWYSSLEKPHKRFKKTVGSEPPFQVVDSGISWLCARHLLSVVLANICVMFSCLCAGALFVLRSRGPALVCCMRRCQTDYHD